MRTLSAAGVVVFVAVASEAGSGASVAVDAGCHVEAVSDRLRLGELELACAAEAEAVSEASF